MAEQGDQMAQEEKEQHVVEANVSEDSSEYDSLDSQAEIRRQAKLAKQESVVEEVHGPPVPDLTPSEIHQLVEFIKKMVTLYDLQDSDWTTANAEIIERWIMETDKYVLTAYFIGDDLICNLDFPYTPIQDITYFLRKPFFIFTPENFHDNVVFGTINDSIEGSLLKILQNIYAPMFFEIKNWPDSVRSDFCTHLHNFLAKLTDLHHKMLGLTVIYIPDEGLNLTIDQAAADRDLIKRLEGIVVHWTRQIKMCLGDQEQNAATELLCPKDEYDFWVYRYENLRGLEYQFKNQHFNKIIEILKAAHSSYIGQFVTYVDDIQQNIEEAKSNIEFLQILNAPCEDLENVENPATIPDKLPLILNLIRVIWTNSPYYNATSKITNLCKLLSNQIILLCNHYINLKEILKGKTRLGITQFKNCIECCIQYKHIYTSMAYLHEKKYGIPWDLDKPIIFNHIDSFAKRCYDMIEICEAMIVFGRMDETEDIPKPYLDTNKGLVFEAMIDKCESWLEETLNDIRKAEPHILDVQSLQWHDEMLKFRNKIKSIELIMVNLINGFFDTAANVEECVYAYATLFYYSKRDTLRPFFDKKVKKMCKMFSQEISEIKADLLKKEENYKILPYYAGRAWLANGKKRRLQYLKNIVDKAVFIPHCNLMDEVFDQYNKIIKALEDWIRTLFHKWEVTLPNDVNELLSRPLMNRSVTKPGLLECNIDRSILPICKEVSYWNAMGYETPFNIRPLYAKYDKIRLVYEQVLSVIMDYNKILNSLSDDERILFKQLITNVEKKISPGLSVLRWSSPVSDQYLDECCQFTSELQSFVNDYKTCNLQIIKICEKICDSLLLSIPTGQVYELKELDKKIRENLHQQLNELVANFQEIINYLIVVYEGFESQLQYMSKQWDSYIRKFDKLVEESIRVSVKTSMEGCFYILHGDTITGPNPLIKVSVDLKDNKIDFSPSVTDIGKIISSLKPELMKSICSIPRLSEKFKARDPPEPFYLILERDKDLSDLQHQLDQEIKVCIEKLQAYLKTWEPFRDMWEVDKERFIRRYKMQKPNAAAFDANIGRYTEVANNVQMQETITVVHFLLVNSGILKQSIIEHCIEWQRMLCELLSELTKNQIDDVYEYIRVNTEKITHVPENLDEMQFSMKLFEQLVAEAPKESSQFQSIFDQFITLDKYEVEIPPKVRQMGEEIPERWQEYMDILKQSEKMINFSKETFKAKLLEAAEDLKKDAKDLLENFVLAGPFTSDWTAKDALQNLKGIRAQLQALREREAQLRKDLGIFNISQPDNPELAKLEKDLAAIELVWTLTAEWDDAWEKYKYGNFWDLETEEMEVTAQTLFRKLTRLAKELKDKNWTIVEDTRKRVDIFRRTLPLISDLKNPAMRERHWARVKKAMNLDFDEQSAEFTLEFIIKIGMQNYSEQINEISIAATMELQIENGLKAIAETWATMGIEIVPYRENIYRVKNVEDALQTIEENLVQLSTMKSTRYVEPFSKEVEYWEKTLGYIMETVENALQVQRQWLYLENIFFGEDIRKQLPKETAQFDSITEEWSDITENMYNAPSALKATTYRPIPYLYNKLNVMNEKLETIQRELERYLETKRQVFPRFYFISNDDMLEILGNAKKPEAVQVHMKKMFDNIVKVKLMKNTMLQLPEADGMFSDDGEYIPFSQPVIIDGPSETWLAEIEKHMRVTLKELFKPLRVALKQNLKTRDKWLMEWCGQLCITASQIQWTSECQRTLAQCKIIESKTPLKRCRRKYKQILNMLSDLSRKDLTKIQRLKANALITVEIHAKEVIDKMYKANCMDVNAFEWFSQLRFYWDREVDDCVIRQTNTSFRYGYEYIGNSGRLVITPLTDRCYITLTTALHLNRGGSPKGPAGTGKTETVKDLGKGLGMWVIVNNCSEGLDYKSMGKMFSGLAQTGAWGCFDEFNRINIEVLSVVAQQILCVLSAIAQRLKVFMFEGNEIKLVWTCGIFITMNPGYAGRTELPDNLKSMFRPISMIVPDSSIIAENILFSDGFRPSLTKILAKKVYTLYQLATQQLSKQDHYDFGLRSMVALLRYGGRKRRAYPNMPEEEIMYLAMRDMNVAKLTADDLPLFNGIMSDIFPGVEIPVIDYEEFHTAIEDEMRSLGLQVLETAVTKVIQLYETKISRHSVMILGKTYTAKTSTWMTLKGALGRMRKMEKPGFNYVQEYPLNPKSVNLGELYGEYNLSTGEWLDGILSAIMRKTCAEDTPDEKWILFDGPVDAVWIENMNSVMDDNKILTLINSERITMPEQVSLLFEVGDLSVASPATVSRCGMVYNDYKDWGWRPYVKSWLDKKSPEFGEMMIIFFDRYLQNVLNIKRQLCEEPVPICELNGVVSLCRLLDCFATKAGGMDPMNEEVFETMAKLWFFFCLTWSVCASVDEPGRKRIDVYIREKEGIYPLKDTIYEYYVDVRNRTFVSWEDKLPKAWTYDPTKPFYKITVPTVDTVRYESVIGSLLEAGLPAVITGPVGTGKTSTAQSVTGTFDPMSYTILSVNMSAQTTSNNVQETVESRVEKRTKGIFVPMGGKKMITFLDDLNMPAKDTYGSQPPLELLRQWIDYGFWYDRKKQTRTYIKDMFLLAAMGPPGGGRTVISDRLLSRFNLINMTFPEEYVILRIFDTMLHQHMINFDDEVRRPADKLTECTLDLYFRVVAKMLPTPTKIHYLFNLRDISKIFQGLLRSTKDAQQTKPAILRLWIHECFRVFYDKLIDDKDRQWFFDTMNDELGQYFEVTFHSVCPNKEIPIFGHFMSQYGNYEDLKDRVALRNFMEVQLEEYNASPGVVRMDLVLFQDAIDHICRIVRVISQPRGNMLLIGIGGSGRQSFARLAAYISEYVTFQIEVKKNYKVADFREDLKQLYSQTGVDGKETTFLFTDNQAAEESFLEILSNMLSSGEVANLYKPDEFEDIKNRLEKAAKYENIMQTTEAMYTFMIERVRKNLHIIFCMSPVGDSFRNMLRQYPTFVSCTTIDWFSDWPRSALLEVAMRYLKDVNFVETITGIPRSDRRRESMALINEQLRESTAKIFSIIHDSVSKWSRKMLEEVKRHNYVTPTNYLELVTGYKAMLQEKRLKIAAEANKLRSGLSKIDSTRAAVEVMSVELEEAKIKVTEIQIQCDEYLVIIMNQSKEAEEQQKQVAADSIRIGEEEKTCLKLADQAQTDLNLAMPALEEAIKALDALNKKDIAEVRSYGKPPAKVEMVLEAVMILKGVSPTWAEAKKQLADNNFLNSLRDFDKNHISEKTLRKIGNYTMKEDFQPDIVGVVSLAAKSLCLWVRAMEKYAKIYRVVAPKQEKLEQAMRTLEEKRAMLAAAKKKLEELSLMLQKLKEDYDKKMQEKEELIRKAEMLRLKLERAALLVDCLASEKIRWEQTVEDLDGQFDRLPGDCLIATAIISYLGPFTSNYRDELQDLWIGETKSEEIPYSDEFNICNFLADPIKIREWNIQGLPSDAFSTENGIIIVRCTRWPLVIDPQCQAQKWIKQMAKEHRLKVIDLGTPNFMRTVEKAIQFGNSVLLQNILETMDPALEPVLSRSLVKQGGQIMMKLGDKMVEYNENFRFYITTKMSNPHYPPEISTKTTLVNFAVKEQGLEAQLLAIVVRKEQAKLEEMKDNMVLTIANGKKTLLHLESELLRILNETRGSLLDDEELVSTLQNSKATSAAVKESLEISEVTEKEIDAAREGYRPCSKRAAILFFVLYDMSRIDPMYQFSLDAYILMFIQSIEKSPRNPDLEQRIQILNEYHTYSTYKNTCRALFENHKLLFSFHMCTKILEAQGKILEHEYTFLLKGGVVLDRKDQIDNPCKAWLDEVAWDNITEMDKLQGFHGVADSFEQYPKDWNAWYIHTTPEELELIGEWNDICNEFQRMLFIRSLRRDRLSFVVSTYIVNNLGPQFIEPPVLDIKAVVEESLPQTPLIFVLSPGVDPTGALTNLAEQCDMSSRFNTLSLGQGQAPIATRMLEVGMKEGNWVFLANCHLSLSWMPALDKIVETLQYGKVHKDFRLWLSSSPHPDFPISILQAGIKMTTEPPRGLRANLKRLYRTLTEEQFYACKAFEKYRKLLFSLCYFHAVLIERKKFQQLGWNIIYSFNDSDFEVSENLLTIYLDEYEKTPWDALKYLIAGVNYGGHVTDDWDRRLLTTYINQCFNEDVLTKSFYRLSSLPTYYIPKDGPLESYEDYINILPPVDNPEAFGQHSNADITSLITEARVLTETLMSLQVQASGSASETKEDKVMQLSIDILSKIPNAIDYEQTEKIIGENKKPLDVVLLQEISRYNVLLNSMKESLLELQKGIKGLVIMSAELEDIFSCVYEGRVPENWLKAYPSLKLLGSWTRDMIMRVEHFAQWAETAHPPILFWLSAYTFPTGFLTAVLQTAARKTQVPIDQLSWEFLIVQMREDLITEKPSTGVYVKGLFLEGAGWDNKDLCLVEPKPMQLVCNMPLIHFKPAENLKKKIRGYYCCPCYYFPIRAGVQGRPAYVVAVDLKCTENADYWIKRGTALLLSLAN